VFSLCLVINVANREWMLHRHVPLLARGIFPAALICMQAAILGRERSSLTHTHTPTAAREKSAAAFSFGLVAAYFIMCTQHPASQQRRKT
jgi:hypothetical protein